MKILHVTLSFARGGRREAILNLARGLHDLGVESHLCCINDFDGETADIDASFAGSIELRRRRLLDGHALRRLRHYVREHAIDVLHAHDAASLTSCALALPHPRRPLLMTFHRTLGFESEHRRDRLRNALVGLRTGAVVVASEERRRHYLERNRIAPRKLVRIPLGIDLARFRPDATCRAALRERLGLRPDQPVLGAAGHFGTEKGIDVVIEAFQDLARRPAGRDAALVVLGTGTEARQDAIRAMIHADLAPRIHLVGYQHASESWFAGFDLLLHGARAEAFGLVLVEAMACRVPVIAAAVGGIPDIIIDGTCGCLVPAEDPVAMANAAAALLQSPTRLSAMADAALQRARMEYDLATSAHRHLHLYQSLCKDAENLPITEVDS